MTESVSRTFIGSVVCIDLVGYSTKSVAQQIAIKEAFNQLLGQALQRVPAEDRIILDTGDGAAVSFLGDPESGLSVAMALRDTMVANAKQLGAARSGEGPVRIGVNLGPMKVALDLNGFPRIVGDGINVAERIAAFAKPGEVVASRSFHDMVSRLSESNAGLFTDRGVHADKNGREHQIYAVAKPGAAPARAPAQAPAAATPGSAPAPAPAPATSAFATFLKDRLKVGFTAALLGVVIALEAAFLLWGGRPAPTPTVAAAPPATASPVAEPVRPAPTPAPVVPPVTAPAKADPAPPKVEPTPPKAEPIAPKVETAPAKIAEPASAKALEPTRPAEPAKAPQVTKAPETTTPKAEPAPKARRDEPKSARREEPPRPAPVFEPPKPAAPEPPREEPKVAVAAPTTLATPVTKAPVSFPAAAMSRNIDRGQVKARLTIDAAGHVRDVKILESYPRRYFDDEATRSLREWRFNAGADNRTYEVEIAFQR